MPPTPHSSDAILVARGLTKRYQRGRPAVLDDCTFAIPAGVVCALIGANGAGKTTLMELAVGMQRPGAGTVEVCGGPARIGHPGVSYLAQDRPLFPGFTVAETLRFGARTNPDNWDGELAERVVDPSRFGRRDRIGDLSGGERTRIALALALGKRADLLLLDEPMADLDVLARRELMGLLMAHVADTGATVVMSSHVVAELADTCDHLLLLAGGRARLCGGIDDLVEAHAVVDLPGGPELLAGHDVIESRPAGHGTSALIRPGAALSADWHVRQPSLEELVVAHLTAPGAADLVLPPNARAEEIVE